MDTIKPDGAVAMPTFKVEDMTCGGCAASIKRAVARIDAGAEVDVDLPQHLVTVRPAAADAAALEAAIREAGFTPRPA
jgi:copper chaperone